MRENENSTRHPRGTMWAMEEGKHQMLSFQLCQRSFSGFVYSRRGREMVVEGKARFQMEGDCLAAFNSACNLYIIC